MEGEVSFFKYNKLRTEFQNSIRHNLSLHLKFLKIPNEDAGKSSWWMINHDLKKTFKPRRRATYGESVDKLKQKAEAARNKGRLE